MARTEAEREMALETIRASAASLTALSSQLLEVSGGRPINKELVDLNEVVERTLAAVAADPAIDSRIRTQLASDLPLVEGEPASLQQVVLNLVTNALKAGTHTDGAVVVTTQTTPPAAGRSNPGVLLGVQDDGPGVPAEYRNRVFDPFFTTSDSGRGLGLATARTITLRHDGEIRLVPRPIGARFDVSFPGIPRQASAVSSAPTQLTDELQGDLSLLLVDDDDAVRAVAARMLSHMRYQVLEADSGPLAVELFESKRPSLAIVDAIMPGMDGVETIKALRAVDPELKVLLYSGYHYAADTKELPAGVGFLPKPFNTTQLTAALAGLPTHESAASGA